MSNCIGLVDSKGLCNVTADTCSHGLRNVPGIRQRLLERCAFVALMIVALVVVACAFSAMIVARQD